MSDHLTTRLHQLINASLMHANEKWDKNTQTPEHYVLLAMTHFAMLIVESAIEVAELKEQNAEGFDSHISVGHYIRNYFTQAVIEDDGRTDTANL